MAGNFTETAEWEEGVPKISNGEEIDETLLNQAGQVLANRTQYLLGLVQGLDFSSSKSSAGYQKLPSGLILQWGESALVTTGNSTVGVTFPMTFPTVCLAVIASGRDESSDGQQSNKAIKLLSKTKYGATLNVDTLEAYASCGIYATYLAIGY